jgi:DNA repair protein RadC
MGGIYIMTNISFLTLKVVKEKSGRYNIDRKINNPQAVYEVATQVIEIQDQAEESMWMITLDTKNQII